MTRTTTRVPRALIMVSTACVLGLGSIAGMAQAYAHVGVDAEDPARGSTATITFRVPNESENGSPTTEFTVELPDVPTTVDVTPGWTAKLDKDVSAGTVRSVTWTAAPGAGIPPDQFEQFQIRITLPDADSVTFPATQKYGDGSVVRWDQPIRPDGTEPEHPAPTLHLTVAHPGSDDGHHAPTAAPPSAPATPAAQQPRLQSDNVARGLAGAALLVASLGAGIALVRRGA